MEQIKPQFSQSVASIESGYLQDFVFKTGSTATERMRIDSSGNVGIGTSSPTNGKLEVTHSSSTVPAGFFRNTSGSGDSPALTVQGGANNAAPNFSVLDYNGNTDFVVQGLGNVGIGTSSPRVALDVDGEVAIAYNANYGMRFYNQPNNNWSSIGNNHTSSGANLVFKDASGEAFRLDGSGNLLVGKTVQSIGTDGVTIVNGQITATADGADAIRLNRKTSDGSIIDFRKDGSTVGSISSRNGEAISIHSGSVGIEFNPSNQVNPSNGSAPLDNTLDLGASGTRWDDIYATNGTIQTSDRNEKQDIEVLSDAETRVAQACKGLLRKFRWQDAVAEKGDDARIHFGIIAQDLQDAFTAEGLDAGRYAMFISSTWWEATETYTDDDGVEQTRTNTYETLEAAPAGATERTRLGVRYPELLAFIIATI
jgi:hypothetical protein